MAKRLIYERPEGGLSVVTLVKPNPTNDDLNRSAHRTIPKDIKYKIIEDTDLPSDRDFRNAWEGDFSSPHGTSVGRTAYDEANP
jgi:hypothetical protein